MAISEIPIVDLSPFFRQGDEEGKRKVVEEIRNASCEFGCFQIINHGVAIDLMNKALKVSKKFFESPIEEKMKCSPILGAPFPAGYNRKPNPKFEFSEYFVVLQPGSIYNVSPPNHQEFSEVMEELFKEFVKAGMLLQSVLEKCLGLPQNKLEEINNKRDCDVMTALYYLAAMEDEKIGVKPHKDVGFFAFVLQDEVGGLELEKDNNGVWIPISPLHGALVVNIGVVLQVLTNEKFKSASHRVMRPNGRSRNSFSFFFNVSGATVLEPLPEFTKDVGEKVKYKRFVYKDFIKVRNELKANRASWHQSGGDDSGLSSFSLKS